MRPAKSTDIILSELEADQTGHVHSGNRPVCGKDRKGLRHDSLRKGYCGYPASVCVSINEEVVHGIPSAKRFLKEGDIVSLDLVVENHGYMADAARTYGVGQISKTASA